MRSNDVILAAVVLLTALLLSLTANLLSGEDGDVAVVLTDGVETGRYPLHEDNEIVIEGACGFQNRLVIKDGRADIAEALCPDKLCVHQKSISKNRETLVCLPNRVVVEIEGSREPELDAVAH